MRRALMTPLGIAALYSVIGSGGVEIVRADEAPAPSEPPQPPKAATGVKPHIGKKQIAKALKRAAHPDGGSDA